MDTILPDIKIGLLGPFGGGNLGDAAIQQAMIQHIYKYYPNAQINGFSLNPGDTEKRHGITSYSIGRMCMTGWLGIKKDNGLITRIQKAYYKTRQNQNRWIGGFVRFLLAVPIEIISIIDSYKILYGTDILMISGGGQLDDYWGGALHHPYSLLLWTFLAKLHKAKVFFVSVGAGPIDSPFSQLLIKNALSLADYRSYRDEKSKKLIERIGFKREDPIVPDLAHSLSISHILNSNGEKGEKVEKTKADSQYKHEVGVGPMSYFDPRIWPERDQAVYMNYLTKLACIISRLIKQGYSIRLFPGEADHDSHVIRDLIKILEKQDGFILDGRIILEQVDTVDKLMEQFSSVEIVIASRFHGVLLPLLLNKPVLALSYHEKINVLMEDIGQSAYCLPIDQFEVEDVIDRFNSLEKNKQFSKIQIEARIKEYQSALDDQYDYLFTNDHI